MKYVLGAVAAVVLLAGVATAQPAAARCWWDGYAWHCFAPRHHGWRWQRHHRPCYWHYRRGYGWYRY